MLSLFLPDVELHNVDVVVRFSSAALKVYMKYSVFRSSSLVQRPQAEELGLVNRRATMAAGAAPSPKNLVLDPATGRLFVVYSLSVSSGLKGVVRRRERAETHLWIFRHSHLAREVAVWF